MSRTSTVRSEVRVEDAWRNEALPPLSRVDHLALALGVRLILWGQRHAERTARAEQAQRAHAGERAAHARDTTFEHRYLAGPVR